jgi:hypothetical protein
LVIDLAQDTQGHWIGSAIVPGFGVKGAPLNDIAVKESEVAFTVQGALGGPTFKGHLTGDGTLTGEYRQAGNKAAFAFKKAGPPQVEPPRVSTPIDKELEGEWRGDMNFAGLDLHVKITLAQPAHGKATTQVQVTGKVERTFPFELVIQEGDDLTLESIGTGLKYEGRFHRSANEIAGAFSQGAPETPLVLRRSPAREKP